MRWLITNCWLVHGYGSKRCIYVYIYIPMKWMKTPKSSSILWVQTGSPSMIHSEHVATPVPKCRLLGRLALEGWHWLLIGRPCRSCRNTETWKASINIHVAEVSRYPDVSWLLDWFLWQKPLGVSKDRFFILGVHLSRRFLLSSKVGASRPGGILAPALTMQLGWWSVVLKVRTMACLAMAVPCTATNHPEYAMYIYLDSSSQCKNAII